MKKLLISIIPALALMSSSCQDYLTKLPEDKLTDDPAFWASESNVENYSYGFYTTYFTGYGMKDTWGKYFTGETLNDDFAPTTPTTFTKTEPATSSAWSFKNVRKANQFIENVSKSAMPENAKRHWVGIGRFFRAMEYCNLMQDYGDVPWFDKVLSETDAELYRPRDARKFVVSKVLEDFEYAANNVRDTDDKLKINKNVVLSFMTRRMLYEASVLKYHNLDQDLASDLFRKVKEAALIVMNSGKYAIVDNYRDLFSSLSLAGNKEVILYREYATGLVTHNLVTYNNTESQTGASKDLLDSYLKSDGTIVTPDADKDYNTYMTNRDGRLLQTFSPELRVRGEFSNFSTTGYACHKFLNEDLKDKQEGKSNLNPTDAPVMRYAEVLLNYAEACAELGSVTQSDLDASINLIRARKTTKLPALQVMGTSPAVNGVTYDDPKRDPSVSPILWEIRRERRVELAMEGFRNSDLKRWAKYKYLNTQSSDINRGAWIRKADHPKMTEVFIENDAAEGYIIPAPKKETQRYFNETDIMSTRVYLEPLPLDQITLYDANGFVLKQNPGWKDR